MPEKKQRTSASDDPAQSKRFIEAARKAEADESEKGADKAFKRVSSSANQKKART